MVTAIFHWISLPRTLESHRTNRCVSSVTLSYSQLSVRNGVAGRPDWLYRLTLGLLAQP
jgi:hypothetical protein